MNNRICNVVYNHYNNSLFMIRITNGENALHQSWIWSAKVFYTYLV